MRHRKTMKREIVIRTHAHIRRNGKVWISVCFCKFRISPARTLQQHAFLTGMYDMLQCIMGDFSKYDGKLYSGTENWNLCHYFTSQDCRIVQCRMKLVIVFMLKYFIGVHFFILCRKYSVDPPFLTLIYWTINKHKCIWK